MSTDDGIATAKYVVRCALAAGDSIRIKDYTGGVVTLAGELGLAPGWKDGQCDGPCQEKMSACLMALTNGDGDHVDVELAAQYTLGASHSYAYQEAAFYGNIFQDPPQAFYCVGKDYGNALISVNLLEERSCSGYNDQTGGECPYKRVGFCNAILTINPFNLGSLLESNMCDFGFLFSKTDAAKNCKKSGKPWAYPITTFRKVKQ